jgi:hypothetical protein
VLVLGLGGGPDDILVLNENGEIVRRLQSGTAGGIRDCAIDGTTHVLVAVNEGEYRTVDLRSGTTGIVRSLNVGAGIRSLSAGGGLVVVTTVTGALLAIEERSGQVLVRREYGRDTVICAAVSDSGCAIGVVQSVAAGSGGREPDGVRDVAVRIERVLGDSLAPVREASVRASGALCGPVFLNGEECLTFAVGGCGFAWDLKDADR